jgi:hypothetical protein
VCKILSVFYYLWNKLIGKRCFYSPCDELGALETVGTVMYLKQLEEHDIMK